MANNLSAIVDSYGCMPEYKDMKAFFDNPSNSKGIQDAITRYGMPVPNRESYNTGFGLFKKNWGWVDFCDWENIQKFYEYAKLSVSFPTLVGTNKDDCYKVKSAIDSLEEQRNSVNSFIKSENQRVSFLAALSDKIADYNSFYGNNSCELYMTQKAAQLEAEAEQKVAETQANASMASAKLGVYVFGAIAAFIGISYALGVVTKKTNP